MPREVRNYRAGEMKRLPEDGTGSRRRLKRKVGDAGVSPHPANDLRDNMIPVNEGNEECQKCEYFYLAYGCIPTYSNKFPLCGRKVKGDIKMKIKTDSAFLEKAIDLVAEYTDEHLDKSDHEPEYKVFVVWYCKTLQNFKALLSTTLFDGMYYEITYNGDKNEIYLDAYKKFENRCVKFAD